MSILVTTIPQPPSILTQVVTAINATDNENATRDVVLDPTNLLLAYKLINKSYGSIHFNNNAVPTVIGTTGTFVVVSNSSYALNPLSSNFSLTSAGGASLSSRLTYNGTSAAVFMLSCCVTFLCAGSNNQSITTQLSLNGVLITVAKSASLTSNANTPRNNKMEAIVTVNPNDYVELQLTNTTAVNNVTVTDVIINSVTVK